jgi:uncharacterized protein (TIGR02246 family)
MSTSTLARMNEPGDLARAFSEIWNGHDMDAFANLFTDDAQMVNVVGMWWHGRNEIGQVHKTLHSGPFSDSRLSIQAPAVQHLSSDIAAVHVPWRLSGQRNPDGTPDGDRDGILLLVAKRDGGDWRIAVAQNTDIVPGVAVPKAPG